MKLISSASVTGGGAGKEFQATSASPSGSLVGKVSRRCCDDLARGYINGDQEER